MKTSIALASVSVVALAASPLAAQDLGPNLRKIKEGIYVQSSREVNSTSRSHHAGVGAIRPAREAA